MVERQRNILAYSVVIVVSIVMLAWVIPTWSPEYPGYGVPATLVPDASCALMLLLAALGLSKEVWTLLRDKTNNKKPHVVGFIPAGIIFLLIIQFFCGQRKAAPMILVSLIPVLAIYAVARFGLNVPMP